MKPRCVPNRVPLGQSSYQLYESRSGVLRSGDSGARTARKSVRPKSVTYVLGTLCHPCVRAGPIEKVARPGRFELPTLCLEGSEHIDSLCLIPPSKRYT